MLIELFIRNFALIDEVRIGFQPGFNVLTGETGAGKSIILDAMALVLGDRADTAVVREGYDSASVEAVFRLESNQLTNFQRLLREEQLEGDEDDLLVLSRELRINGRNICRINGHMANLARLRSLGDELVDIHGQGDHLSLLKPRSHLPLLDAYAGLENKRREFGAIVANLSIVRGDLEKLRRDEQALARRQDLLTYQIGEIEAANLQIDEEDELRLERSRLANVEQLIQHGTEALNLLDGFNSEAPSASDRLDQAERLVGKLAGLDEALRPLFERFRDLNYQLNDLSAELLRYSEQLEHSPKRLNLVEERLELISDLKRKYGDTIDDILTWRDEARVELANIVNSEQRIEELSSEEERLLRHLGQLGQALSLERQAAAGQLATDIEGELADLNMEEALFDVDFSRSADEFGVYAEEERTSFDETGIDKLEFLVSTNPGESPRPLAKVASGGETSRLMLALKSILARVDATPTLIFDEIDQGIGGRVGDVVGQKLWRLTTPAGHQVIVVTHLPQLAGYADGHFRVSKQTVGDRTITGVKELNTDGRIEELAAMLGSPGDYATGGAESIIQRVDQVKDRS